MKPKYTYSELRKREKGKLPADVNDMVKSSLKPLEEKFGGVYDLIDTAQKKCWYSDKPGAVVIDNIKGRAVAMLEFHYGIIKKFSLLQWFGDTCYFPVNIKNSMVDFSKPKKNKPISNGVK